MRPVQHIPELSLPPNLFRSLFEFRKSDHSTAKENYLTEALIYTLRTSPPAARAWVKLLTGRRPKAGSFALKTRSSSRDEDTETTIFPDVEVNGLFLEGDKRFRLIVEHKWDAPYDKRQLERYARLKEWGRARHLAFVCANARDHRKAIGFKAPRGVAFTAFTWEDVYTCLKDVKPMTPVLEDFLRFMSEQGLSPGEALTPKDLIAAANAKRNMGHSHPLRVRMRRFCEKLENEYDWDGVPARQRQQAVTVDSYGRCAVVLSEHGSWKPGICLGFYYDVRDHKIPFVDPAKGIDLAIRIQADPRTNPNPGRVIELLRGRIPSLEKLGVRAIAKGDPGHRNAHTLLLVQKSLTDVIGGIVDDDDQIAAIHRELNRWCKVLFDDAGLRRALGKLEGYKSE